MIFEVDFKTGMDRYKRNFLDCKMAQSVIVLAAKSDDLSVIPETYMIDGGTDAHRGMCVPIHIHNNSTYKCLKNKTGIFFFCF